jgi:hypothetical protein
MGAVKQLENTKVISTVDLAKCFSITHEELVKRAQHLLDSNRADVKDFTPHMIDVTATSDKITQVVKGYLVSQQGVLEMFKGTLSPHFRKVKDEILLEFENFVLDAKSVPIEKVEKQKISLFGKIKNLYSRR